MPKLILGFVGQAGAGKGTAAKMIAENYGAVTFTFSDILSRILDVLLLEHSRDNLIKISMALRQAFGQDALSNTMEKQVAAAKSDIVIVDGIRRIEDIENLARSKAFHLIEITARPEIRFERLKRRNEKPGESDMTWDDFLEMSQKETEKTIVEVAQNAELIIENNGDLNEFKACLDNLITKLKS